MVRASTSRQNTEARRAGNTLGAWLYVGCPIVGPEPKTVLAFREVCPQLTLKDNGRFLLSSQTGKADFVSFPKTWTGPNNHQPFFPFCLNWVNETKQNKRGRWKWQMADLCLVDTFSFCHLQQDLRRRNCVTSFKMSYLFLCKGPAEINRLHLLPSRWFGLC